RVGCFKYSPVEGAPANDLGLEPIPEDVQQDRLQAFDDRQHDQHRTHRDPPSRSAGTAAAFR
ncbi:MAG TPA: hypothetical protein EYP90_00835, partial [Chromatiaceae bacterium]|nr:hypothetical protein [Chromatiaceae bacterium]